MLTFSPHSIRVGLVHTAAELNLNLKVEVTNIASVWLHAELPADLVALVAVDLLIQVEHGLLPVGGLGVWGGGEGHLVVALGELDVEEGDKGMEGVVPLDLQVEGSVEGDLLLGAGLDINLLGQVSPLGGR